MRTNIALSRSLVGSGRSSLVASSLMWMMTSSPRMHILTTFIESELEPGGCISDRVRKIYINNQYSGLD